MKNRDIRVQVLLNADEYTWLRDEAEEHDMSQSLYVRRLILKARKKVEMAKLSDEESNLTRVEPTQLPTQQITELSNLFKSLTNHMLDIRSTVQELKIKHQSNKD